MKIIKQSRYAVFGNPIHHTQSPKIHSLFYKQIGIESNYVAILVPIGKLTLYLNFFFLKVGWDVILLYHLKKKWSIYVIF